VLLLEEVTALIVLVSVAVVDGVAVVGDANELRPFKRLKPFNKLRPFNPFKLSGKFAKLGVGVLDAVAALIKLKFKFAGFVATGVLAIEVFIGFGLFIIPPSVDNCSKKKGNSGALERRLCKVGGFGGTLLL
jgi:hypothetical protein